MRTRFIISVLFMFVLSCTAKEEERALNKFMLSMETTAVQPEQVQVRAVTKLSRDNENALVQFALGSSGSWGLYTMKDFKIEIYEFASRDSKWHRRAGSHISMQEIL